MRVLFFVCYGLLFVAACTGDAPSASTDDAQPNMEVPAWSKEVVWYQVFVERFRNGDPSNDPTLHDTEGSWPHAQPDGWQPTPWTHDWYQQEDWAEATGEDFYYTAQLRRYGGDLQGVLDQLDYLHDLGVTALYLNPINDAPSLHKYDARTYRHIDRTFGPNPQGDEARIAAEDPTDPATWRWTAADSLFLTLVDAVHQRGMRIILDYSWNHTGITFWAWKDLVENQQASPYADWYEVKQYDDPATPENEFDYEGWLGVRELPELKKVGRPEGLHHGAIEGDLHPDVKAHVFNVTRRWLDPDGDGDPSDGIDGFRLDVAEMVPLGFWRDYRRFVRRINPEAYLVGEVWWEQWPDRMQDPTAWLQGDVFDAVMHYRWYMPTRSFFAEAPPHLTSSAYVAHLDSVEAGLSLDVRQAMMNLTASHDSPRFGTSIYNPTPYKYRVNPRENPDYRIDRPDARTRQIQTLILIQQFTYVGAPHIWNGDEVGMWGGDDPDVRKPLVWPDLVYDDEVTHPFGLDRRRDVIAPDTALFRVYQDLIALRQDHLRLFVDGTVTVRLTDDARRLLAYERVLGDARALVVFNASDQPQPITVTAESGVYRDALRPGTTLETVNDALSFILPPLTASVWMRE